MTVTLTGTQFQAFTDLNGFLTLILPPTVEIVDGQDNRVPEPELPDFVVMTPTRRGRLATNVDESQDCSFMGSIAGGVLTITDVLLGLPVQGVSVFGVGIALNTLMGTPIAINPDGTGTWNVTPDQTLATTKLACGTKTAMQETQLTVQLDVHGPNSSDNAQIITTLFRDDYATTFFDAQGNGTSPLYADDARQMPFENDQQQVENRWVIMAEMQINPVVTVPLQYADALTVVLKEIDATFPPVS